MRGSDQVVDDRELDTRTEQARSGISIVFADDHPAILDAVGRHLDDAGFTVIAAVEHGVAALAAVEEHQPTVCIADLHMPKLDGVSLVRHIATTAPETRALLYTGIADSDLIPQALDAGARGLVLKNSPLSDLIRAIDTIAADGIFIDPVLGASLAIGADPSQPTLTDRERQVLHLLAQGNAYGEIGAELYLSEATVRSHAQRAMTKLNARTRAQAVAIAVRTGVIS